ncbi:hypothetical protein [Oceanicella actignis]|uniref:hypothetical protein n=1 Tax=Oceanicella actignis TaxID=1189325 RepID=UPI000F744B75|nr:hypothetical protein [Oceanicella actignis]
MMKAELTAFRFARKNFLVFQPFDRSPLTIFDELVLVNGARRAAGAIFGHQGSTDGRSPVKNEWMIDVLADLRQFALRNYYISLAEQIDDAIVVAAVELKKRASSGSDSAPSETHA